MKIHNVLQGSPEWLALRAAAFTASEAPAMMGCSPYTTRTELLVQKHTGLTGEVDGHKQRLFDQGHATEAQFRPIAEDILGDDLYPVTGSIEIDGLTLLASFDGLTMDYRLGYEHKLWSKSNVEAIEQTGEPPIYHCWQMEHQMLVSGAEEILFCTSDGTAENSLVCRYRSKPERRTALLAGWKQFASDLANYVPSIAVADKPTGKAPETLPALRIELAGTVTASNLDEFKETALGAIRSVNRVLATDQDFADAEQSVKWCEDVESRLEAAKEHALSQTASIDALFKTIDDIAAEARKVRLELKKLVETRKNELRQEIVTKAIEQLTAQRIALNSRLGKALVPLVPADFAGAIKGKRNLDSMQDAVNTELARAKIAASELADRMEANIKSLAGENHDWGFLFPDLAAVAGKSAEDFSNLLAARIAAHKQVEEQRREREAQADAARKVREAEAAARAAEVVKQAAAPIAAAISDAINTGTGIARMTTESVTRVDPATVRSDTTMKLGQINERLAPLQVSQAALSQFGIESVGKDKQAVLYRESDFPRICNALIRHLQALGQPA